MGILARLRSSVLDVPAMELQLRDAVAVRVEHWRTEPCGVPRCPREPDFLFVSRRLKRALDAADLEHVRRLWTSERERLGVGGAVGVTSDVRATSLIERFDAAVETMRRGRWR